jgi:hypothetical protein
MCIKPGLNVVWQITTNRRLGRGNELGGRDCTLSLVELRLIERGHRSYLGERSGQFLIGLVTL